MKTIAPRTKFTSTPRNFSRKIRTLICIYTRVHHLMPMYLTCVDQKGDSGSYGFGQNYSHVGNNRSITITLHRGHVISLIYISKLHQGPFRLNLERITFLTQANLRQATSGNLHSFLFTRQHAPGTLNMISINAQHSPF